MDLLTRLRSANVRRCMAVFHQNLWDWSILEWTGAMAGEAGEAVNLAKKIKRGDYVVGGSYEIKDLRQTIEEHIADEVADTVIYGDLALAALGVSLESAIIRKFNRVSQERGTDIVLHHQVLPDATTYHNALVKLLGSACHGSDCPSYTEFPDESNCECDEIREDEADLDLMVMCNEMRELIGLEPETVRRTCKTCDGRGDERCPECGGEGVLSVRPLKPA